MNKFFTLIVGAIILLSSCSKQKYTASFSPSKPVRYTKLKPVEKKEVAQNTTIEEKSTEEIVLENGPTMEAAKEPVITPIKEVKKVSTEPTPMKHEYTRKEIKTIKKQVRKQLWKEIKQGNLRKGRPDQNTVIIAAILALFIPPLGVWYYQKDITTDFWLSLLLWFMIILPGVVYAWLVIFDVFTLA